LWLGFDFSIQFQSNYRLNIIFRIHPFLFALKPQNLKNIDPIISWWILTCNGVWNLYHYKFISFHEKIQWKASMKKTSTKTLETSIRSFHILHQILNKFVFQWSRCWNHSKRTHRSTMIHWILILFCLLVCSYFLVEKF
jgi:hypothetical protein